MPLHWDWDWDCDWPHDHFFHWPTPTRLFPCFDSYAYQARCPISRRWKSTSFAHHDYDVGVCARDWHLHHHFGDDPYNPWCHRSCLASRVIIESGDEPDSNGKGTFKVVIDVHHFRSDELMLKVRNNDTIILTGKQNADRGGGEGGKNAAAALHCITREFTRKYKLPRNYDATLAKATRSTDGMLTIMVPAPPPLDDVERVVDIAPTGAYFGTTSVVGGEEENVGNGNGKAIENGDGNENEGKANEADEGSKGADEGRKALDEGGKGVSEGRDGLNEEYMDDEPRMESNEDELIK